MKNKLDFDLVILGTDINAYYMARCYHEKYHRQAHLIGKEPMNFTRFSNMIMIYGQKMLF